MPSAKLYRLIGTGTPKNAGVKWSVGYEAVGIESHEYIEQARFKGNSLYVTEEEFDAPYIRLVCVEAVGSTLEVDDLEARCEPLLWRYYVNVILARYAANKAIMRREAYKFGGEYQAL